ncbi:hypothetical protein fugu_005743 [Takifugu bimaculatus]|uniref:Uncharacterized protein n=1 Tax=Takifugu bimaculatus TaxID=433685 RepID=A0A4Z2B595_9TELE|nr:hypothetical protein fugu_005743 [Takifugu bimaculatus]
MDLFPIFYPYLVVFLHQMPLKPKFTLTSQLRATNMPVYQGFPSTTPLKISELFCFCPQFGAHVHRDVRITISASSCTSLWPFKQSIQIHHCSGRSGSGTRSMRSTAARSLQNSNGGTSGAV